MPGWCKHYRAMFDHRTCDAGVTYAALRPAEMRPIEAIRRMPCFPQNADPLPCRHRSMPSAEELAAEESAFAISLQRVLAADVAVRADAKATGRHAGEIACPTCKARLRYMIAASNGHSRGQCETQGCTEWMQ